MPTRAATCLANFSAELRESKSSATIRLLRGWASKVVKVRDKRPEDLVQALGLLAGTLRRQLHQFQPHLAHPGVDQAYLPGYAIGYINFAPFLVGTPVIDTYQLKPAIAGVDDAHPGAKGQVRVGGV